eukprot:TRINITY_DN1906_c0_g1_i2.p1 TRINITY_DN1906_c0_g1~~TRINITY_DN1906_c0_g1_i2.p1  ORF type:complete len:199 (-),score=37.80 TRINITY_DN1906_c0_g1_i2:126-722(-)
MLEELKEAGSLGEYKLTPVNLAEGEQRQPAFLAINPHGKIPALVDPKGTDDSRICLFESGSILIYLAEKFGLFLPKDASRRAAALSWTFWQASSLGPIGGQLYFYMFMGEKNPPAKERYETELMKLVKTLENHLGEVSFLAGDEYSIADMMIYPWAQAFPKVEINMDEYPNIKAWSDRVGQRPAVQRGMELGKQGGRK